MPTARDSVHEARPSHLCLALAHGERVGTQTDVQRSGQEGVGCQLRALWGFSNICRKRKTSSMKRARRRPATEKHSLNTRAGAIHEAAHVIAAFHWDASIGNLGVSISREP